jgi:hypothetical protein
MPNSHNDKDTRKRFEKALNAPWQECFFDSGSGDWKENWFLDGERAVVRNTQSGMFYSAGPIEWDHASHAVLWTKDSFEGNILLEYDYTRLDTINRWVNIIYIQATGSGNAPYTEDISEWNELRQIPYMHCYFDNMNLLHISYAAYGKEETTVDDDYVRLRRYIPNEKDGKHDGLANTDLKPDNFKTNLFIPGRKLHIRILKNKKDMFMEVCDGDQSTLFSWDVTQAPAINKGRVGLRHMWMRAARYADFKISTF